MTHTNFGRSELVSARKSGRFYIISVFLFSSVVNLLFLTGPLFMLQVYDRVLGSRSEETLVALFILVGVLYAVMAILDYVRGRVLARFGAQFQETLDERVFTAVLRRSLRPAERGAHVGGMRDLETIQGALASPGIMSLFDLPWTPIFFAALFVFHPMLGWLGIAGGAVLIILTMLNQILTKSSVLDAQSASAQASHFADQIRTKAELARAQGMLSVLTQRWRHLRQDAQDNTVRASDVSGLITTVTKALRLFLQSAMLALGAWLVLQGEMTAGAMIAASILLGRGLGPIEQSLAQWPQLQKARAGWLGLIRLLSSVPPAQSQTELPRPKAALMVADLTVVPPGSRKPNLRGVSFALNPGQVLGVIGKSGSGKSTLARALVGLWTPSGGEVRLDSARLDQYESEVLGSYIGYLPQDVVLFTGTVAENIARMSLSPNDAKVVKAAKIAGAHDLILTLPQGYDTVIEGGDIQLSGGQRQRLALARAVYGGPELLILDEPNSALDAEGSNALGQAIRAMKAAGKSVIIMTHRPTAIAECDTLVVLDQGAVKAYGPRDQIMNTMLANAKDVAQAITPQKIQKGNQDV